MPILYSRNLYTLIFLVIFAIIIALIVKNVKKEKQLKMENFKNGLKEEIKLHNNESLFRMHYDNALKKAWYISITA